MKSTKTKRMLTHLDDYLVRNARECPDKLALVCVDKTFSWRQLENAAHQFAGKLSSRLGIQKHQALVGLLIPNTWQYVVAYLAILKTGHTAVPIDASYKQLEIEAILRQLPVQLVIGESNSSPNIQKIKDFMSFEAINAHPEVAEYNSLRLRADEQVATLLFTSGTTGVPKAAPNTHANQIWNVKVCSQVWDWTKLDTLLVSLRLSHMYGIILGLSGSLYHGNTMYLQEWFDPQKTLEALDSGDISVFQHVPLAYQEILNYAASHELESYDLSKVRLFTSGGGPLPPEIWQSFRDRFGVEIIETYGTSETGRIAGNHLDDPQSGSPGYLFPGVRAKLSNSSELLIKSQGVFPGYYKNSKATNAGFTKDGWWRTGDIAQINDGRVFLKGRVQEKIRKSGYTISPRDIEWALLKNSAIKEAYVMAQQVPGRPNDNLIYFLSGTITESELSDYTKQNLLFAWRPDKVFFLTKLPRTPSGKIKIPILRKLLEQDT